MSATSEKRAGRPVLDFIKAVTVGVVLLVIIHVPLFAVVTGAVLTALLIAGVWK